MKTLEELINLTQNYMSSLSNLPVFIIIGAIITILLATIFTKNRWIKFIPGIIAMIVGISKGLRAWKYLAEDGMLDSAWMAIIFVVSGFVSFCLALILHMYIKKTPKSKKKKEQKINEKQKQVNKNNEKVKPVQKNLTKENNPRLKDETKVIKRNNTKVNPIVDETTVITRPKINEEEINEEEIDNINTTQNLTETFKKLSD